MGNARNVIIAAVARAAAESRRAQCQEHEESVRTYYCLDCDQVVCDRCLILGAHRGHDARLLAAAAAATAETLDAVDVHRKQLLADYKPVQQRLHSLVLGMLEGRLAAQGAAARRAGMADVLRHLCTTESAFLAHASIRAIEQRVAALEALGRQFAVYKQQLPYLDAQIRLAHDAAAVVQSTGAPPALDPAALADHLGSLPDFQALEAASLRDPDPEYQIFIHHRAGLLHHRVGRNSLSAARVLAVTVRGSTSLARLRELIRRQWAVSEASIMLLCDGKRLYDGASLCSPMCTDDTCGPPAAKRARCSMRTAGCHSASQRSTRVKIVVRTVKGERVVMEVGLADTVLSIKQKLSSERRVGSTANQKLMHRGRVLSNDSLTVRELDVSDGASFVLFCKGLKEIWQPGTLSQLPRSVGTASPAFAALHIRLLDDHLSLPHPCPHLHPDAHHSPRRGAGGNKRSQPRAACDEPAAAAPAAPVQELRVHVLQRHGRVRRIGGGSDAGCAGVRR